MSVLIVVAILSFASPDNERNTHFKHGLEWNYFIGVVKHFIY